MKANKSVKLTTVNYKQHKKGDVLSIGKDISKEAAAFLVKSKNAEYVIKKVEE